MSAVGKDTVEPTARALALHPHVQAVMSELGRLLSAGRDFSVGESSRVFRIIGSDAMSLRVLPRLCAELSACGSACWFTGFALAPVALVRAVGQVEILFTLLFSRFYLGEQPSRSEIAGALVLVLGVVLVLVGR